MSIPACAYLAKVSTTTRSTSSALDGGSFRITPSPLCVKSDFAPSISSCADEIFAAMGGSDNRRGPIQHVDIDLIFFLRRHSPIPGRDRASASAVDRVSVFREPLADRAQAGDKFPLISPLGRANIQQQVRIVPGSAHQLALQIVRTLVVAVADVESPGAVERVGTFERELVLT